MRILLIIVSFFLLTAKSCNTAAPRPPQVELFVVLPDEGRACRDDNNGNEECVYFNEMDGFITLSPEDATDLTEYIIDLNDKCKRWERK